MTKNTTKKLHFKNQRTKGIAIYACIFAVVGVLILVVTQAATPATYYEAESTALSGCARAVTDTTASGGQAVSFDCPTTTDPKPTTAGASLPITYDMASLSGTVRYVATNGSDSNSGTSAASPFATLGKAIASSTANDTIVVRGGTYRNTHGLSIGTGKNGLHIVAYPNEIPIFNGADVASSGWTAEGSLSFRPYTPRPVTDAHGISFSSGQNLKADGLGKYPDQAWVGNTQLQQVAAKTDVDRDGEFWVDRTNNRLYIRTTDLNKGSVEVSSSTSGRIRMLNISSSGVVIEGLRITRYSVAADDYGVLLFNGSADNSVIKNVELSEFAFLGVMYTNTSSDLNTGSTIRNTTIDSSAWMGVNASYTTDLVIDASKINDMNHFDEFTSSPQSGALKTSRTRGTKVTNSVISNNKSHGLWFDQSNIAIVVANTRITDNTGSGMFFEISDGLTFVNNYVKATSGQPIKIAGSSGVKLVNNTIVGGKDPIGVYTDSRSKPGCADPSQPLCSGSPGSDRDTIRTRPTTLDWMPRIDMMINNVIAYPTATQFCGSVTPVCVTTTNSSASTSVQAVFHPANTPHQGLPKSVVDGNVYANGTGRLFVAGGVNYTSLASLTAAMAASPISLSGFEANGLAGNNFVNSNGSPTAELTGKHGSAVAVPTDATVNAYISAGTRRYGVTYSVQ